MPSPLALGLLAWVLALGLYADSTIASQAGPRSEAQLAPGWGPLSYEPPEPGHYRLPPLGEAADAKVLDEHGRTRRLHAVLGGRIVLIAFIYTSCSDINGCPLATAVMHSLYATMQRDAELKTRLRLISVSFDPRYDTPERLRLYARALRGDGDDKDWSFLTTSSDADLKPLLASYGQAVEVEPARSARSADAFAHALRVLLIDPERRIRNIYSASFLHRDLVLSDVRTLLQEASVPRPVPQQALEPSPDGSPNRSSDGSLDGNDDRLSGIGDDPSGHDAEADQTGSGSLGMRRGAGALADLPRLASEPQLGLPPLPVPSDNPLTAAKIDLGRKLFFDRRLSFNETMSCAMCHIPEQGFTSNEMATAVGVEGRTVRRNAPTLLNVPYVERLFHDGRESSLEQQIWGPMLARNEMGNLSVGAVLDQLKQLPDYDGRFQATFGRGPSMETLGMALASYQRTLLAADSPFDRWYFGTRDSAVSAAAKRGFEVFRGKGRCAACHLMGSDHALFSDQRFHNTGVGYRRAMGDPHPVQRVRAAPGVHLEVPRSLVESVAERRPSDLGLYEVTQEPADRWKYRTPTLRNVALTAPYMHDGSLATLAEIVDFYDRGGIQNENLSPLIQPLDLTEAEKEDLVAFLNALTGRHIDRLVADAFAAEIGDRRSDPASAASHDSGGSRR